MADPILTTPPAQQQQANDWRSSLPEDIRGDASLRDIADVPALAKSFVNAQKLIGTDKIAKPTDKWTPEQWRGFYKEIGAPDKPEAYELPKELKLADGLQIDQPSLDAWRKEFMEAGLTKAQANRILSKHFNDTSGNFTAQQQQRMAAHSAAETELKQEFGREYDANVDIARATLTKFGNAALTKKLVDSGLASDPDVVRMFVKLGKLTVVEGTAAGGGNDQLLKSTTQATQEINRLKGDKDFQDALLRREHSGHKAAVDRWFALHQAASSGGQSGE